MTEKEARSIASKTWPDITLQQECSEDDVKFIFFERTKDVSKPKANERSNGVMRLCYLVFKADRSAKRGTPLTGLGEKI